MIKATIGNMFDSTAKTLVNTVNCVGVMGKGVALEFKKRFPAMYEDYLVRVRRNEVRLGRPYLFDTGTGRKIVNFPTKGHWRSMSRLQDIAEGLDYFAEHAVDWGLNSVAMPPLGCGNGGLDWADVGPLIYTKLKEVPIDVVIYAPYGTPPNQLTDDFLRAPTTRPARQKGRAPKGLGEGAIVLLEALRQIYMQPFAQPVGRTKFQKVGYALTLCGVPTGYRFTRQSFGPFSTELRDEALVLSNSNWLEEEQLGSMFVRRPTYAYEEAKSGFDAILTKYSCAIKKTTDLFSRIKDTDQAEVVATVLFAYHELVDRQAEPVAFDAITDYVTQWKPKWGRNGFKLNQMLESAVTLAMTGWADRIDFANVPESALDSVLGFAEAP